MKTENVVGIITGGAAGFGRAFAERILQGGGSVFITDVNVEQLEITGRELAAKYDGSKIGWTHQDVTDPESFHRVFDRASKIFRKPINLLTNNAGIAGDMTLWNDDAPRTWEPVVNIDLTAVIRGTQVAVQQMKKHLNGREGVIVNVASFAGLYPNISLPVYAAVKHGVIGLTRSCRSLKEQLNIRVFGLAPGYARTAMGLVAEQITPWDLEAMGGMMEVRQVVDAFERALQDDTNPGRIVRIVRGGASYNLFPGDKALYPNAKL